MKKFIVFLVILLIISAVIFYFGWIQLKVPKDTYGIIYTKTNGYLTKPVTAGKFYWSAHGLIPKNIEIIEIPAAPRTLFMNSEEELPSSKEFSTTLIDYDRFSYLFKFYVSYKINSSTAVNLVVNNGLTSETIDVWYQALDAKVQDAANREIKLFLQQRITEDTFFSVEDVEVIQQRLQFHFPDITIEYLDIVSVELPDFELYEQAKIYYYELTALKNSSLQKEMLETAQQRAENEVQLDLLRRYGDLFDQFPILIEYIKADPDLKSLD